FALRRMDVATNAPRIGCIARGFEQRQAGDQVVVGVPLPWGNDGANRIGAWKGASRRVVPQPGGKYETPVNIPTELRQVRVGGRSGLQQKGVGPELRSDVPLIDDLGLRVTSTERHEAGLRATERAPEHWQPCPRGSLSNECGAVVARCLGRQRTCVKDE